MLGLSWGLWLLLQPGSSAMTGKAPRSREDPGPGLCGVGQGPFLLTPGRTHFGSLGLLHVNSSLSRNACLGSKIFKTRKQTETTEKQKCSSPGLEPGPRTPDPGTIDKCGRHLSCSFSCCLFFLSSLPPPSLHLSPFPPTIHVPHTGCVV